MSAFVLRLGLLFVWYIVDGGAATPPTCPDSSLFTANVANEWNARCPPAKSCKLGLVKYKIVNDPQKGNKKWKFDETSTCYLCLPTCCRSRSLSSSWCSDVCNGYLLSHGFYQKDTDVWGRHDDKELTYVVLKERTKYDVYLRLPGKRICSYIVKDNKYVMELCDYIQMHNIDGAGCPQGGGVSNGGMCAQPMKVG